MRNIILEELADALDDRSGQFRYFFVASSGRVTPYAADDPALGHVLGRPDAILVTPLTHADAYAMVGDFIDTLADGELADRLRAAISGSMQQGRFLQVLGAYPRARKSWLAYRQRRLEALALEWLRGNEVDLPRFGLDRPPRPNEEATDMRFDAGLEERLSALQRRVTELSARGEDAARAWAACHEALHVDEVYHSNALRGNCLDRAQTEEVVLRGGCVGGVSLREHLEAINVKRALDHAEVLSHSAAPLTEHSLRELHAKLFTLIDDANAGEYRRTDARIVGRDYLPPESVLVPALLREFTEWLEDSPADPVAKAAAVQAKLAHIAPFEDGNGRVARLLTHVIFDPVRYPPAMVRVEDRERYYSGLRQADTGDMTELLALLIDCVERSLSQVEAAL